MLKDFVYRNRSYRRFNQRHTIDEETVRSCIDLGRMASNGGNLQPLKYIYACTADRNAKVFETLSWAAYLSDWNGPEEGERPTAYVIVLNDSEISKNSWCEAGIAVENIMLGFVEQGLGGCIFRSIDRKQLTDNFNIPEQYEILMVLAIGEPIETVSVDAIGEDGSIKYWRDENKVHHVPKRSIDEIILDI